MAEKAGKTADVLVVPGVDPFDAMVQTAAKLKASRLVTGVSAQMDSGELARRIGLAWENCPNRAIRSRSKSSPPTGPRSVNLGPHPPACGPKTWTARTICGFACKRTLAPSCIIAMW